MAFDKTVGALLSLTLVIMTVYQGLLTHVFLAARAHAQRTIAVFVEMVAEGVTATRHVGLEHFLSAISPRTMLSYCGFRRVRATRRGIGSRTLSHLMVEIPLSRIMKVVLQGASVA
jgi:hypothetical protein